MLKPRKRTGLIFFPAFDWAISPSHPEREERLLYTQDQAFKVLKHFKGRISLKDKMVGAANYVKRKKFIFYDTDGISEQQEETVRICGDCGGLVMIESVADTGNRIFAVILPGRCCPACRSHGEMFFEQTNLGKHNRIYFQDRERDVFLVK